MPLETIVAIYRRRWQIESLFKQIKQNFPLRYFYGGRLVFRGGELVCVEPVVGDSGRY